MAAKFMTDGEHRESRNGRETKAVQVYRTILAMETALEAYCYGGATFWVYFLFVIERLGFLGPKRCRNVVMLVLQREHFSYTQAMGLVITKALSGC